jgi:hypothetical protein
MFPKWGPKLLGATTPSNKRVNRVVDLTKTIPIGPRVYHWTPNYS